MRLPPNLILLRWRPLNRVAKRFDPAQFARWHRRYGFFMQAFVVGWTVAYFFLGLRAYFEPRVSPALVVWLNAVWIPFFMLWVFGMVITLRHADVRAGEASAELEAAINAFRDTADVRIEALVAAVNRDLQEIIAGEDPPQPPPVH